MLKIVLKRGVTSGEDDIPKEEAGAGKRAAWWWTMKSVNVFARVNRSNEKSAACRP